MKTRLYISALLVLSCLGSFGYYVFSHSHYPEKAILGEWKEVSWVYDRNNDNEKVKQEKKSNCTNKTGVSITQNG
jgi:hypothetical protein